MNIIPKEEAVIVAEKFDAELRELVNKYQGKTYAVLIYGVLDQVKFEQQYFHTQDRLLVQGNPNDPNN